MPISVSDPLWKCGLTGLSDAENSEINSPFCTISSQILGWVYMFYQLFWCNREPLHEPAELLLGKPPYFRFGSRPLAPLLQPFIQEKMAIRFPNQSFDVVRPSATEKIKRIRHTWFASMFCLHDRSLCINSGF